ncbi:MAG: hypothetical protein ABEL76_01255 [Bradymonadaceae bacterium]
MADVFVNKGELFDEDRLAEIDTYEEWNSDAVEEARTKLEELYEKREAQLAEGPDEMETRYYWVSYVLRALGFAFSAAELTPEYSENVDFRPDFTLFQEADELRSAIPHRGEREFFVHTLAIMRAIGWDDDIDDYEGDEGEHDNPIYDLDELMRMTGVDWGICTNGRIWRLYHADSVGLLDTYYEVDLVEALHSKDPESFKYFWSVFSPEGLGGMGDIQSVVYRLLK